MPERRTSSSTSFMPKLHFSGKVIMASVLFGFGLLLVGAILLIIATGGQKRSPILEDALAKKNPMTYVGPGVMGVGAFFVIVGTIMCLFETRILRRRKNTDHESLVSSEILPTGNASPPTTVNQEDIKNVEETQVKTVHAECHVESPARSLEKTPLDAGAEKGDYDRQLSTSTDKQQAQSLTASVYVEAVGENDTDENDNEEQFTSGSLQFSTPPQGEDADVSKISVDSQPAKGHDRVKIPDSSQSEHGTAEAEKGSSLLLQKETENPQTVSERDESSLLVLKDNEIPLAASDDSIPIAVTTHSNVSSDDLAKANAHPMDVPESTEELMKSNKKVSEELQNEGNRVLAPIGLPDTEGKRPSS